MKISPWSYTVWIEAEAWEPGTWMPEDCDTDVIVIRENGSRWVASFFTYRHIQTLVERYRTNGECLSGAYFWSSDMLLIDEASRQRIEEVIEHLIKEDNFESVFTRIPFEGTQEE